MKSDKGDVHSYLPVYEELLAPYREYSKNVLEIGLFNGASLLMWEKYFLNANVYGVDCDTKPHDGLADLMPLINEKTHNIFIRNAENKEHLASFLEYVFLDVVIEDANHSIEQQIKIYENIKPYMHEGGIYIIEDIQDIDKDKDVFIKMGGEIIDLRKNKGRYDDVLVIFKQ